MAVSYGPRTLRKMKRLASEEEKVSASMKADREKYRLEEKVRREKIGATLLELAASDEEVHRVIVLAVEQIRQERGGRIFDNWKVPGPPDPDAVPSARKGRSKIASATDASDNQTGVERRSEADPDLGEAVVVQDTRRDETQGKNDLERWEAKFATKPDKVVLDKIKKLGGKWNSEAAMWVGTLSVAEISRIKQLIEDAGGTFIVVSNEPPLVASNIL